MLRYLAIENYGLIRHARIDFAEGATVFTGETGSGKTMVLGALGFALGSRGGADVVRRGASKAAVTLGFDCDEELLRRFESDGYAIDPGEEATIVREVGEGGRSSIRVNGRPSTAGYVRELADAIGEIVGQHEAQRLLSNAYHLELLDRFAGEAALRARGEVAAAYAKAGELSEALAALQGDERAARQRYDDARFALREIEEARAENGEDARLDDRRRLLENGERIASALRRAHEALAGDDVAVTGMLGDASVALSNIAEIAEPFADLARQASALQSEAGDLAGSVARSLEAVAFDPAELETINARLDTLDRLKRKYGGTLESAIAHGVTSREIVESFEGRDRRVADLATKVAAAARELGAAAQTLTALRKLAAKRLQAAVAGEFADLALGSARFEIAFEPIERIGPSGAERVELLFAANPGEPVRALSKVASGGELSRVLLALVVALAGIRDDASALVFDEIDAGIGGVTATAVGARIGRLAKNAQVVCVTHLAQLATWADRHYVLEKIEGDGETTIAVREIEKKSERESELARMLSGETHDAALAHARALLEVRTT